MVRRLKGIKKFLEKNPEYVDKVVFVQIAVPSRTKINSYRDLKESSEEIIREVNEHYEDLGHKPPIDYHYRSFPQEQLATYYDQADIALVTPLRDGMNLVAKEYIAVKRDKGVLILSELAGAAYELGETVTVNPWNPDAIADAIKQALEMSPLEQSEIMSTLYQKVSDNDLSNWVSSILQDLSSLDQTSYSSHEEFITDKQAQEIYEHFASKKKKLIALDYDGTLVNLMANRMSPKPDRELIEILTQLSSDPNNQVAIVSGRSKEDLTYFFGESFLEKILVSAEHGLWLRYPGHEWHSMVPTSEKPSWYGSVKEVLRRFTKETPGSLIEEKNASIVWHYRQAEPELGIWQARELATHLTSTLANEPAEVLFGKYVIEIRPQGIHKGNLINYLNQIEQDDHDLIIGLGDDVTDEALFEMVGEHGISIKVGEGPTKATHRLKNVKQVRAFLANLAKSRNILV